jgi:hypothetical protein
VQKEQLGVIFEKASKLDLDKYLKLLTEVYMDQINIIPVSRPIQIDL